MSAATPILDRTYHMTISLGEWCGVSYNLRRHFRQSRAYPFDWWVTPYAGLCKMFDENFSQLLRPSFLVADTEADMVRCAHYGVVHPHDFMRDGNDRLVAEIAPQIAGVRAKFESLIARMDADAQDAAVLAIRHRLIDADAPDADPVARAAAMYDRLARRWPAARLDLLVVEPAAPASAVAHAGGRIVFDALEETGEPGHWQPTAWSRLFARQQIRLAQPSPAC